jgi:hypothetical protein
METVLSPETPVMSTTLHDIEIQKTAILSIQ